MDTKRLRVLGKRVLVQPLQQSARTDGGLHLAESYLQPSGRGTVVSVGSGVDEADLKAGSRVFYNWIHGREVQVDGQSLRLLETDEILGVEHES